MSRSIKVIFCGTPEFAVPYLEGLLADPDFLISGVLTQPDKPSGRKQTLSPSAIKLLAQKNNLKIWQPETLRGNEGIVNALKNADADLLVVVAYGQIIPKGILDLFKKGAINVHPSLLPKYRGASPIQSALLAGEKETGVSIMLMDDKMDHGPILSQEKFALIGEETNESLHKQLAVSGVALLINTAKRYLNGEIKPQTQNDSEATFCATITKADGRIDWSDSAQKIKQKIYALYPWPTAWTTLDNQRLKIFPPAFVKTSAGEAGKIEIIDGELAVNCREDKLILKKIQLEGKKEIDASDFIRGHKDVDGKKMV